MIHAIVNLPHTLGTHPHHGRQPGCYITANRDVTMDQRPHAATQQQVLPVPTLESTYLPAVFPVHPLHAAHTKAAQLGLQRGKVTTVHNGWPQCSEKPPKTQVETQVMARGLFQLNHIHTGRGNTLGEVIRRGDTNDHMPVSIPRKSIDDIHQAVLQPTGGQGVNHMCDQRHAQGASSPSRATRLAARASAWTAMKSSNNARAASAEPGAGVTSRTRQLPASCKPKRAAA